MMTPDEYQAGQKEWLEKTGLKPGDRVRVISQPGGTRCFGCGSNNHDYLTPRLVGQPLIMQRGTDCGIYVSETYEGQTELVPFYVLIPVGDEE